MAHNIKESIELVRSQGRHGDTVLAHLTHEQSDLLKKMGGSGTINSNTGLREYFGPLYAAAAVPSLVSGIFGRNVNKWDKESELEQARKAEILRREREEFATLENAGRATINQFQQGQKDAELQHQQRKKHLGMNASQLPPQLLMEEAQKLLMRDRGRLAGSPIPQYKGETAAPMSALTQRAQALQNKYMSQPSPYQQKIDTVLSRPNQGLDISRLMNPMLDQQKAFANNEMMNAMRAQMGHATPKQNSFLEGAGRGFNEAADVSRGNLNHLSNIAGGLEGKRNVNIAEAFRGLQANTQARRNAHIQGLTQMGQQKHAHGNMMLGGQKAQFNEEVNAPYEKMGKLHQVLNGFGGAFGENGHPDMQKPLARELIQGLEAYGVNTGKPLGEWDNTRRDTGDVFRGARTAQLPPEVLASHAMMEGVTPRPEGVASDERRRLVQQFMSPESLSEKAMQNIPEHIRPQIANLRRTAQRNFGNNVGQITNRYIQANQPFSLQHTNEVQNRAEEVARRLAEEEAEALKQGTASQLSLQHDNSISDLKRLGEMGEQEQTGFRNMMGNIATLNKQGTDKWSNDQNDLEDIFQNYQVSSPWSFSPQMKQDIMAQGMQKGRDGVMAQMGNPDYIKSLALGNPILEQIGNRYNTLQKESLENRQKIANEQQAQAARQEAMRAAQENGSTLANPRGHIANVLLSSGIVNSDETAQQASRRLNSLETPIWNRWEVNSPERNERISAFQKAQQAEADMLRQGKYHFLLRPGEAPAAMYNRLQHTGLLNQLPRHIEQQIEKMSQDQWQKQFQQQQAAEAAQQANMTPSHIQKAWDSTLKYQWPAGYTYEKSKQHKGQSTTIVDPNEYEKAGNMNYYHRRLAEAQQKGDYLGRSPNGRDIFLGFFS